MRISFYAPLKPPDHPNPSGDRRIARLLIAALELAGNKVQVACRLRSRVGDGDSARQARLRDVGAKLAHRLVRRYRSMPEKTRPQLWFTYHLYHKAPDWVGPLVCRELGIPYVIAEASHAPKQKNGPWSVGFHAAESAIQQAAAVICFNPDDIGCLEPIMSPPQVVESIKPFLQVEDYAQVREKPELRKKLADQKFPLPWSKNAPAFSTFPPSMAVGEGWGEGVKIKTPGLIALSAGVFPKESSRNVPSEAESYATAPQANLKLTPWLITVAMMRPDAKLLSYQQLGAALENLIEQDWRLFVVGDGTASKKVEQALSNLNNKVTYLGKLDGESLKPWLAACDLFVWPAQNEAFGMAMLEAQASGLPVVAGNSAGVAQVVSHEQTGLLVPQGDSAAFAKAVHSLLQDPKRLAQMGESARNKALYEHDITVAARDLQLILNEVLEL